MKTIVPAVLVAFLVAGTGVPCYGEDPPAGNQYVTREEYDKLKKELDEVKAQLQQFLPQKTAAPAEAPHPLAGLQQELKAVKRQVEAQKLGTTKFLLAGYGSVKSTVPQHGAKKFGAAFNPIFLWKLNDQLFFQGEPEFELEGSDTTINLEQAYVAYLLNDYITLSGGRFLNPSNFFVERLHPDWINKMPDKPLAVYDGFLPESLEGFQVRGGVPMGSTKVGYALFASNAPSLRATDDATAAFTERAGTLKFKNFDNVGNHIAVGGRVGFLPIPQLEVGYGVQGADVSAGGTSEKTVGMLLQSADLNYVRDSDLLQGVIDLKTQWVWSDIGRTTYDPTGALGFGPLTFNNHRNGGYAQLAYRPTKVSGAFFKNLESILRFDVLNQSAKAPGGFDERRWTLGLDYWLTPSNVVKLAYELEQKKGARDNDAVLLQWATGF